MDTVDGQVAELRKEITKRFERRAAPPAPLTDTVHGERIFVELMTSHRKLKASREGSK